MAADVELTMHYNQHQGSINGGLTIVDLVSTLIEQ
jgi:hypothetical protein